MIEKKRKFENDLGSFKKDIEDMEIALTRAEQVSYRVTNQNGKNFPLT